MRSGVALNLDHPVCVRCGQRHLPLIACAGDRVGFGAADVNPLTGRVTPAPDLSRLDDEPMDWPAPERELSAGWGRRGRGER